MSDVRGNAPRLSLRTWICLALVFILPALQPASLAQPGPPGDYPPGRERRDRPPGYGPYGREQPIENEGIVIEKGFVFLEGQYLSPPYTIRETEDSLTINGQKLECLPPELDGFASRGFGPPRGGRWRYLLHALRSQPGGHCLILSFAKQPVVVFDGASAYFLLKLLTQGELKADREMLTERLPAGFDREIWSKWLKEFRAPPDLVRRATALIATYDNAEKKAASAIAATRRLNALAYPLTMGGFLFTVLAVGHMLGGRPHANQPTIGVDDSPAAISAFHWTLVMIALLSTLDIVWTFLAAQAGQMRELNPLGSHLVNDPRHLIGYKVGATFPSLALLWLVRRYKRAQIAAWWICLILTVLSFRWLAFNTLFIAA